MPTATGRRDRKRKGERRKERNRARQRELTAATQEIGRLPAIGNYRRRRRALDDFGYFCRVYFPDVFCLPWAEYHLKLIEIAQRCAGVGGMFAFAMPRGSGKTAIARALLLWAVLSGRRKYVCLVGASEKAARRQLGNIKRQILTNGKLIADFPCEVLTLKLLENQSQAARGQRFRGELTLAEFGTSRVVFPWLPVPHARGAGAVIEAFGITGEIRGQTQVLPDGRAIRPDFAIVDDAQTRKSAKSTSQTQDRFETLMGDVAYLAGPDERISLLVPCTVIETEDLSERVLGHELFASQRVPMLYDLPHDLKLWDEYAQTYKVCMRRQDTRPANKFYRAHREAMDRGARPSWPHRHLVDEVSAIQHAMNLRIRDRASFDAEGQQKPRVHRGDIQILPAAAIMEKQLGLLPGLCPDTTAKVVAFTDIQQDHFFYAVIALANDFTAHVIAYGGWPDQKTHYFTREGIRFRLSQEYPGDTAAMMHAGLSDLEARLFGPYTTTSGRVLGLARWGIDGNFRAREPDVKAFAIQSEHAEQITLTYGLGVRATERPLSLSPRSLEWQTGPEWCYIDGPGAAAGVFFDANYWKSRLATALNLPAASRGGLTLYKAEPYEHQMMAEHLHAEFPVEVRSRGRMVYQWSEKPNRPDNDGLDCLVGCLVVGSIEGITRRDDLEQQTEGEVKTFDEYARQL